MKSTVSFFLYVLVSGSRVCQGSVQHPNRLRSLLKSTYTTPSFPSANALPPSYSAGYYELPCEYGGDCGPFPAQNPYQSRLPAYGPSQPYGPLESYGGAPPQMLRRRDVPGGYPSHFPYRRSAVYDVAPSGEFVVDEGRGGSVLGKKKKGNYHQVPSSRRLARMLIEQGFHHDEDHLLADSRQLYRHLIQKSLGRRQVLPDGMMMYGKRPTTTTTTTTPVEEKHIPFEEGSPEFEAARKVLATAIKDVIESPTVLGISISQAEQELMNSTESFRNRLFAARSSRRENEEEEEKEVKSSSENENHSPELSKQTEDVLILENPPVVEKEEVMDFKNEVIVEHPLPSLPPPTSVAAPKQQELSDHKGVFKTVNGDL